MIAGENTMAAVAIVVKKSRLSSVTLKIISLPSHTM
jgi:hypothetical protein